MKNEKYFSTSIRVIFILLTASLISHCGFALKRDPNFSETMPEIYIAQAGINSSFINLLEKSFADRQVVVVDTAQLALNIISYDERRRAASINSANANQIETQVSKSLHYSVSHSDTNKLLISPTTITIYKEYINDNANIAGKAEEAILISEELDREMVTRLFRRLRALPPVKNIRFSKNVAKSLYVENSASLENAAETNSVLSEEILSETSFPKKIFLKEL